MGERIPEEWAQAAESAYLDAVENKDQGSVDDFRDALSAVFPFLERAVAQKVLAEARKYLDTFYNSSAAEVLAHLESEFASTQEREARGELCGQVMVGSGTDTYDPLCELPQGHEGPCKSSAATDQHRLPGGVA